MYEMALDFWGIKPKELLEEWTEEQLVVMFRARAERLAPKKKRQDQTTDSDLFKTMGLSVEKRKVQNA